jgi:hypothetical protein
MNIDEALYKHLSTYSGLTALVNTRIYPIKMPDNTPLPAVSLQKISTTRTHTFQQDIGITSVNFQISTWTKDDTIKKGYAHAQAVSYQIRKALQNYNGTLGGTGGVVVNAVLMTNEMDDYDPTTWTYSTMQEFEIWYQED